MLWINAKRLEMNDRVVHDMKVLTDCIYFAGIHDQVNAPALIFLEIICRRIQAIVGAHSTPGRVDWSDANAFTGEIDPEDCVDPALRNHVFQKKKVEPELQQTREKTRKLRGAPFADGEGDGDVQEEAPKGAKGGRRGKNK